MAELKIFSYYQKFTKDFEREKKNITKVIKNKDIEIHHIGSTAISGLGGKGMIDIMLAIDNWKNLNHIVKELKSIGFKHIHPKQEGRVFLSKIGKTKFGDTHIHIVKKDGKQYKNLLFFRNYLKDNKKEAEKYFNLKLKWSKEFKADRKKYTDGKTSYIKEILKKSHKK